MKIAIAHYHLKPGGVTNVIKHQIDAISNDCDVLLLTGKLPAEPIYNNTLEVPGLGYDTSSFDSLNPIKIANDLSEKISSEFGGKADILHIHNPTLAKNSQFQKILKEMQEKGYNLFLQIHDFAENGRPSAYFYDDPYITNCHFGVINSHDYDLLLRSGLKPKGLHLLPNDVVPITLPTDISFKKDRILYPVRAIRRKNIGEAILISLFINNKILSITLPPNSAVDIKSYQGWKYFIKKYNLNVEFDSGLHHDFEHLISSSEYLISTSISEGFGFSFLEPWTADKFLWGREIATVCNDFTQNGMRLDHLYKHLNVPVDWIGENRLIDAYMKCISDNTKKFNLPVNYKKTHKFLLAKFKSKVIDFGLLDEPFQKEIISKVLSSKKCGDVLRQINSYLTQPGHAKDTNEIISNNKKAVLQKYNRLNYKTNLISIYKKVANESVTHHIEKQILASYFLNPDNFSLLQWNDYAE